MNTKVITEIADYISKETGYEIPPMTPFVGENFNLTRAGIHALRTDADAVFEGRNGSTVCFFTFVTDISTESIKDRGALAARRSLEMTIFGKRMLIFRKIFIQVRKR